MSIDLAGPLMAHAKRLRAQVEVMTFVLASAVAHVECIVAVA